MLTHSLLQPRLILFIVLRAGVIFPFYRKQTLDTEKWRNWLETTQFILWTLSSLWSSQRSWGILWRKECILRHFSPFPWRAFPSCCPHHHHPPCPGRTCIYCFSIWRGRNMPMHAHACFPTLTICLWSTEFAPHPAGNDGWNVFLKFRTGGWRLVLQCTVTSPHSLQWPSGRPSWACLAQPGLPGSYSQSRRKLHWDSEPNKHIWKGIRNKNKCAKCC